MRVLLYALSLLAAASPDPRPTTGVHTLTVAPATLPRPTYCLDTSTLLTASGGLEPYTFAVTGGTLPPGLLLGTDGSLTGVASTLGVHGFTVTATDADGCTGSASYLVPIAKGFRAADDQVGLVLPAGGTGGSGDPLLDTVTSSLVVSGIGASPVAVTALEVHVTLLHERAGDLVLTLVAPDGTRTRLADRRGEFGQDFLGTVFRDAAAESVCDGTAPFTGDHRPEEPLGTRPANGTWTLEIVDAAAGSTGLLLDWALDVRTATAGPSFNLGSPTVWDRLLAEDLVELALDPDNVYVTSDNTVTRIPKHQPYPVNYWERNLPDARGPLVVERSSFPILALVSGGSAFALDVDDGATLWSRDLRRPTCAADTLSSATACQIWSRSDCAFRAAVPGDLVYFGTRAACTGATANRVIALDASNGNVRWTFNTTGSQQMDRVSGMAVDTRRNRLFVTTEKADPSRVMSTVWALDTRNGTKAWSVDKEAILARPILADGLLVLSADGDLHKLDPDAGTTEWSLTLAGGARDFEHDMAYDPLHRRVFAVDSAGELHAVEDLGTSAATVWTQATIPTLERVAVTPTRGWVYASSRQGRVYQIDGGTGAIDLFKQMGAFAAGDAPRWLVVDETLGGGFVEARLMTARDNRVTRYRVPWYAPDSTGTQGEDTPIPPYARLSLLGSTTPVALPFGEPVTDTLSLTNLYNHAPDCAVVQATLPPGATLVGATVPGGTVTQVGNQLVVRLGRVEIGETVVVELILRPGRAGTFARTYSATSDIPSASTPTVALQNEVQRIRRRR